MDQSTSTVLMVRPASFGYNAETAASNFFQQTEPWNIQQKAVDEFDAMVYNLREHGIEVIVIRDNADPLKPDAVFPNNWFRCDGKVLTLFPMLAENRRAERRMDIIEELISRNLSIHDLTSYEADFRFLEGTGSIICDHINKVMYACISPRTDKELFINYARWCNYTPVWFHAKDSNGREIYHTNVMMCIGTGFTIICDEAIDEEHRIEVLETLRSGNHEIIPISQEQVMQFAGNLLELQGKNGKLLLMSATAFKSLSTGQLATIKKFAEPLVSDVSSIEHTGGGSVRCMVAEIF